MGWNEQATSINVNLVEDPCSAPESNPKFYYPLPGQEKTTTDADPGFVYPTVGAPVYFRVGDFEFAGVIQSWSQKSDSGGNPTFNVSITDPRFLLENLQLIVSDYADSVEGTYNLINVYGFLESLGTFCPEAFIGDATFGSPANGFGGARNNDSGTPWTLVRDGAQALLTGNPHPQFSPYGFAVYRGHNPNNFSALGGMGALNPDSFSATTQADFNSGGYLSNYYVDISEIPFAPEYYRISGPSTTLMALVSQICSDAGCDYFIELFVTPSGDKIIKVRTALRRAQPVLGQIEDFVDAHESVTTKNVGRELRNEPTSVFAYGGYIESLYTQDDPEKIHQYWGVNSSGIIMQAKKRLDPLNFVKGEPEWWVDFDIAPLTPNLHNPLPSSAVQLSETEMRMAIVSYDSWREYALYTGTDFGHWMASFGQKSTFSKLTQNAQRIQDQAFQQNITVNANLGIQNPASKIAEDMNKIHSYIANYAEEHYGKQFIAELPLICYSFDTDTQRFQFSDNPSPDGGWPAAAVTGTGEDGRLIARPPTGILGLSYPSGTGIQFFYTEQDKINPILKFIPGSGSGAYTDGSNFIFKNSGLYVKGGTQHELIISGVVPYPTGTGGDPVYALLTIDSPVTLSGLENSAPKGWGALIHMALANVTGKPINVNKDILGTKGAFALPMETRRIEPDAVVIPMRSNTNRYGPWRYQGPPGPVTLVTDDSLVPWEYGGYTVMNRAADEKIKDAVTFMQVGERGSFTIPGYPIKKLGQEVRSDLKMLQDFAIQQRTFVVNQTVLTYWFVDTQPLDGTFGPNITQISTSVGSNGLSTTYNLATFTPSFGRLSKLNANRIKKVADQRQQMLKEQRRQRKLAVAAKQVAQKAKQRAIARKQHMNKRNGASNIFTAGIGKVVDGLGNVIQNISATIAAAANMADQASSNNQNLDWRAQAMMSTEGLVRPVSKKGGMDTGNIRQSGFLPQYTRRFYSDDGGYEGGFCCDPPAGSCTAENKSGTLPSSPIQATPPMISPVSTGKSYIPNLIYQDYLDPFATPQTPKHLESGVEPTGTHHDVDVVGIGSGNPEGQHMSLMEHQNQGNPFPEDFRMMALRGPLLINGWGYDLDGKPVPNSADTISGVSKGEFTTTNLTNSFHSGWLRRPEMWPVAPLDLRFDRIRGVWTTPPAHRMLFGEIATSGLTGGEGPGSETGLGIIWNGGGTPAGPTGEDIFGGEYPEIIFKNVLNLSGLTSGTKAYFHWDPNSCTYFPIIASGGGGGSGTKLKIFDSGNCNVTTCTDSNDCIGDVDQLIIGRNLHAKKQIIPSGTGAGDLATCFGIASGTGVIIDLSLPLTNFDNVAADQFTGAPTCFTSYSEITFGSGIDLLAYSDTGTNCSGAYVQVPINNQHYDFGCQGEPAGLSVCKAGGTLGAIGNNSGIIFGYGLDASNSTGTGAGQFPNTTVVNKKLRVEAPESTGVVGGDDGYVNRVETIDLGCGLSGTHVGGKKCTSASSGAELCSVKIEINPLADQGGTQKVKLVNGICCTGAHITASFKTLIFSSCGLFIEATGGTGCCT